MKSKIGKLFLLNFKNKFRLQNKIKFLLFYSKVSIFIKKSFLFLRISDLNLLLSFVSSFSPQRRKKLSQKTQLTPLRSSKQKRFKRINPISTVRVLTGRSFRFHHRENFLAAQPVRSCRKGEMMRLLPN